MGNLFVLDDDAMYHRIIELLVARHRPFKNIDHYYNGDVLLKYLWANKDDGSNLPDVLLVDINMPIVDGWTFLERLTAIEHHLCKKMQVYMATTSVMQDKSANYSIAGYFTKPLSLDDLNTMIVALNA